MELSEYIRRYSIATLIVDGEYDRYSTHLGIDESEWTILYALYPDHHLSQKRICEEWRIPSSTVNTTTMRFRDQGLIAIEKLPGSRREMHLFLTPKGKEEAERILEGIFHAEKLAMETVLERYGTAFIDASELYAKTLSEALLEEEKKR